MAGFLRFLAGLGGDVFRARRALICENALLRQQLIVAERRLSGHCVRWRPWERYAMALAVSRAPAWQATLLLVQPATILRWHRIGLRAFLRHRSRPGGRPPTARASPIREMAASNPLWGAERIRGELLKLGIRVCKRTVQKYMLRPASTGWRWPA